MPAAPEAAVGASAEVFLLAPVGALGAAAVGAVGAAAVGAVAAAAVGA